MPIILKKKTIGGNTAWYLKYASMQHCDSDNLDNGFALSPRGNTWVSLGRGNGFYDRL